MQGSKRFACNIRASGCKRHATGIRSRSKMQNVTAILASAAKKTPITALWMSSNQDDSYTQIEEVTRFQDTSRKSLLSTECKLRTTQCVVTLSALQSAAKCNFRPLFHIFSLAVVRRFISALVRVISNHCVHAVSCFAGVTDTKSAKSGNAKCKNS